MEETGGNLDDYVRLNRNIDDMDDSEILHDYYKKTKPFTDVANGAGFWSSTEKIMSTTGWRPRIGIDEGIVSTLKVLDGR